MNSQRIEPPGQDGALHAEVSAALFAADPMGVNSGGNLHEYDPVARSILVRLPAAHGSDNVQVILHDEFSRLHGKERAGAIGRYEEVSEIVWEAWLRHAAIAKRP
jgi:hypothetical protein